VQGGSCNVLSGWDVLYHDCEAWLEAITAYAMLPLGLAVGAKGRTSPFIPHRAFAMLPQLIHRDGVAIGLQRHW
jgi:hypothetical protein